MISTQAETQANVELARALMLDFAHRTGLSSGEQPRRYLWTDAFAVCNFLGLAQTTGESSFTTLALRLIDQVHQILGRHRPGDSREGWLSGLDEREGAAHPTAGGLRIGKKLPERPPDEPFDERLEWDRDGQYFHYLTKWMHALDQTARATGKARFNQWARELAQAAHGAFCYGAAGKRRMVWKVSTDLRRPLVHSMGQHDALDGFVTTLALHATACDLDRDSAMGELIADFGAMVEGQDLVTTDPLGLGGLLSDAARVAQLGPSAGTDGGALVALLLDAALQGLPFYAQEGDLRRGASGRLAFRELGLAIGLHALDRVPESGLLDALATYAPLATRIDSFWRDPAHRRASSYDEHRDINDVMLATSLAPAGFVARLRALRPSV
jgi:hypothetical protein